MEGGGLAAVVEDLVVRLGGGSGPHSLQDLVECGDAVATAVWERAVRDAERGRVEGRLGEVALAAPLPRPRRNVICVGKNYQAHVNEVRATALGELPEHPIFFTKATTAVIGPSDPVPYHAGVTERLDY
ncbi:MAG TPA: 5-carboxymethyl-2-hydroxymuconate isomerase, partial [Acidobacteria bacterium]|nr:5-carboxymethyl-2-hydroxymuconate isomerase [Acidobacteriota bacterium]